MDDEVLVDIEARRVLADAQMHRGDPRGELFALQDALARTPEDAALAAHVAQLLIEHHDALYGPLLAPLVRQPTNDGAPIDITWRHGLATDWVIRRPGRLVDPTAALADPLGKQLRRLEILEFPTVATLRAIRAVAGTLRELAIKTGARLDDLGAVVGPLPELVDLDIAAEGTLGSLVAPKLARASFFSLDISALLDADVPALRELVMHRAEGVRRFVAGLAAWPALAGLRRLVIVRAMGGFDFDPVVANARAFAHLELLDLSHNTIDRALVRDVRGTIPGLQIEPMALGAG